MCSFSYKMTLYVSLCCGHMICAFSLFFSSSLFFIYLLLNESLQDYFYKPFKNKIYIHIYMYIIFCLAVTVPLPSQPLIE